MTKSTSEITAQLDQIQVQLASSLTAQERREIAERLAVNAERVARLRQFPLENGDAPAPGFHPFRQAGS